MASVTVRLTGYWSRRMTFSRVPCVGEWIETMAATEPILTVKLYRVISISHYPEEDRAALSPDGPSALVCVEGGPSCSSHP